MGDVPRRTYSAYRDGILVLVVYGGQGVLRRAGAQGAEPMQAIPWAECVSFNAKEEPTMEALIGQAKGLDDFLFKLKLEGYELRDGEPKFDLPYRRW